MILASSRRSGAEPLDAPYLHLVANVPVRPIFIMGPHRSGTTLFYTLLAATGRFSFPSVYTVLHRDCLLYHHFHPRAQKAAWENLRRIFREREIRSRVYDALPAEPDCTEEYCYALEKRGRRPGLTPENLVPFHEFLRKVAFTQGSDKPVLLKNPYDAARFLEMQREFPDARFLFIHRNPVQVMDSQMRMFHLMLDPGNQLELVVNPELRRLFERRRMLALARRIYNEQSPVLFWQALYYLLRCDGYVARNIDALGEASMSVTYPELCADPNGVVRRALEFLRLDATPDFDLRPAIHPRHRPLLPLVARHRSFIERRTTAFRRRFGV